MIVKTLKSYRFFLALICLILILVLTSGTIKANGTEQTETDIASIDAYITEQMNKLGIPGMALGIVQDGQIAHLQGFGVADSSGRKVTPQTPFYIASVTKSFTALAVMQLVEEDKIDLDAPVQTYLPWFQVADREASVKITVRNLLNHTTGISTIDGDRDWTSQQGLEEKVRGFNKIQLNQPVGATYQYSNVNYDIAGLIVEKVSGQHYADYVVQHIFEPLDMHHSYASRAPALADGLSEGHHYMFGHAFRFEGPLPPAKLPSGLLIVSAEDMTHYAIAQLNDGQYGDTSILSPQGITELQAPAIPVGADRYYAMGWIVGTLDGIPFIGHSGALCNFRSEIFLQPEENWGVIMLANASGFEQLTQVTEVAKGIVSLMNGKAPVSISRIFKVSFLYWAILLIPLLQVIGIVYSWRYWRNKGLRHILLIVILYGTVSFLWLFIVPNIIKSPIWSAILPNTPELGYGLIVGATLGIGWSVIYIAMDLMSRRSK